MLVVLFILELRIKTKNDLISFLQATNLSTQESTVKALKSTLDKIDPMDYKTIKSVNDETNRIKKALKVKKQSLLLKGTNCKFLHQVEVNSSRHHDLEQSIRGSSVSVFTKIMVLWPISFILKLLSLPISFHFHNFNCFPVKIISH